MTNQKYMARVQNYLILEVGSLSEFIILFSLWGSVSEKSTMMLLSDLI